MHQIILHPQREKSLLRHHPWIFSKAVAYADEDIKPGELVKVLNSDKAFIAQGHYSPRSQIRVRVISFNENDVIDKNFIKNRIQSAVNLRKRLIDTGNDGVRIIAAEGDFLPGLIVDKYNNYLSISISSYGIENLRGEIITSLQEIFPTYSIYERSDTASRLKEGLKERCGAVVGDLPPDILYVKEGNSVCIPIDIKNGHKTGGYLDQRKSRMRVGELAKGCKVLNCFSYTGGFGLWALKGGAVRVENVDISAHALDLAKQGVVFNHLDPGRCRFIREDVFKFLRDKVESGEQYDLVILDPPKFIDGASNLKKGCRGYQDINRLGLLLTKKGGRLLTFSCSGLMDLNLFQKIVADAALDANVNAQLLNVLRQDEDHVIALPCPESFYLKGLEIAVN